MNEELKEYIIAKKTPISSCVGLSKYFIGRHKVLPVYLKPEFEIEFNNKMCELEKLKEQLEASEKARKEAIDKLKTLGKFNGENFTRSFTLWSADFNELAKILNIDKGE